MRASYRVGLTILAAGAVAACGHSVGTHAARERATGFAFGDARGWGLVDATGRVLVPPRFEYLTTATEGRARLAIGDRWGFVDTTGRILVTPRYQYVLPFAWGFAAVADSGGRWGYVDTTGREVIAAQFDSARSFSPEGRARVFVGQHWGFIDRTGHLVIPAQFDDARGFDGGGLAPVALGGRWGFIDTTGRYVVNLQYDGAEPFTEGRAAVRSGSRWGAIDSAGTLVIPPQFDTAFTFVDGLAAIRVGHRWGYIAPDGHYAIPPTFTFATDFRDSLAAVYAEGRCGFIDRQGHWRVNPQYEHCLAEDLLLALPFDSTSEQRQTLLLNHAGATVARAPYGAHRLVLGDTGAARHLDVVALRSSQVEWRARSGLHAVVFDAARLSAEQLRALEAIAPGLGVTNAPGSAEVIQGAPFRLALRTLPPGDYPYHCWTDSETGVLHVRD